MTRTKTQSYWANCGAYKKESEILDTFVPSRDNATDERIEMYRIARNVYYDIHTNGGCNLLEGWARNNEYQTLIRKFPNEKVKDYMTKYQKNQNRNYDEREEFDYDDSLFQNACEGCDEILNDVIEWIKETDFFEEIKA